ncbi:hypothetical protein [Lysinibacillus sp. BSL11]
MLNELQKAYNEGLKNLVFVDFKNATGEMRLIELELANQKACCEDVMTAINLLIRKGDYDSVRERLSALENSVNYMENLEKHIKGKRLTNFCNIASSFFEKEVPAKVVNFNAHQN